MESASGEVYQSINALMVREYFGEGLVDLLCIRKLDAIKLTLEALGFKRRGSLSPRIGISVQQDRIIVQVC
jgi:hypothetical protein